MGLSGKRWVIFFSQSPFKNDTTTKKKIISFSVSSYMLFTPWSFFLPCALIYLFPEAFWGGGEKNSPVHVLEDSMFQFLLTYLRHDRWLSVNSQNTEVLKCWWLTPKGPQVALQRVHKRCM